MKTFILLLFCSTTLIFSQTYSLTGKIFDKKTQSPLEGVNIYFSTSQTGTTTDSAGKFSIDNLNAGQYEIIISHIGYEKKRLKITLPYLGILQIPLSPTSILLSETLVKSTRAKYRETPVAFSEVEEPQLNRKMASQDVPFVLQTTPGIYISPEGGGIGDLRLSMRGFDQTNIAIMLNGVPVNNPENGQVYWSNWAGMGDVVDYIQVQRGLGATPYSVSAVGGLINIVTKGVGDIEKSTKIRSEFGADNFRKYTLYVSSPLDDNHLGMRALITRKNWDGYADQTWENEFTYYFTLGGIFGNHSLELQVIGSPQEHGQRLSPQTVKTWSERGLRYNPDWGYLNGRPLNLRDNQFHKPTINLNHNWKINDNLIMSNIFYYTYGKGGGTVPGFGSFDRTNSGLIDFDKQWKVNTNNIDSTYSMTLNRAQKALRFTYHTHNWTGFLSTLKYELGNYKFTIGADGKYYAAQNFRTLSNLLGGDYYIGTANINRDPKTLLNIGDKVDYDADSFTLQYGGFLQVEQVNNSMSYFVNLALANTAYSRIDYFNYKPGDPKRETDWDNFLSYTAKAGINYKLDNYNHVFFNIGEFSKAPLSEHVFDFLNNKYQNIKNEKIFSAEIGYGLNTEDFRIDINGFYTTWKDKAISRMIQDINTGDYFYYNISGANALHNGIELETKYNLSNQFSLEGMLSYSANKWTNDVNAAVYPESDPTQQTNISSYVNDVYVGNFPMTTAALSFTYKNQISNSATLLLNPVYKFFGRHYADYNPDNRSNSTDKGVNSWRLPDYFVIDLHGELNFRTNDFYFKNFIVRFHIFNVLDRIYITDAIDGSSHNTESALVWYGRNRWWDVTFEFDL